MTFEQIYKHDIFANEAGVILDEVNENGATMHLKVEKRHLNGGNTAHGAVIYLLADIALAAIANFHKPGSVTIQSDIRFLAAAFDGDTLTATATEVFGRKSFENCKVEIKNQNQETIAIAEGMLYCKKSFKVE